MTDRERIIQLAMTVIFLSNTVIDGKQKRSANINYIKTLCRQIGRDILGFDEESEKFKELE